METNINEIIERDWNDAEMDAVALAGESLELGAKSLEGGKAQSFKLKAQSSDELTVVWNGVVAVLILALVVALCLAYCKCRELKATERARTAAACPSGTAQRVVDEVNREPFVRVCNAVSDVVLGK